MIDMDFTAANQNRPDPSGKLAVNIMHFARVLREAGLPVGPGQVLDALDAANCGCLRSRDDFYWTLHAVFVKRREHREIFDQAFHVFWKKPKMLEQLMQLLFHQITRPANDKSKKAGFRWLAEAMFDKTGTQSRREEPQSLEFDATFTHSSVEVLRSKDFEQMTVEEQALTKKAIERLRLNRIEPRTRRFRPALQGERIDLRGTLKGSLRAGGHLIDLERRDRQRREPPI